MRRFLALAAVCSLALAQQPPAGSSAPTPSAQAPLSMGPQPAAAPSAENEELARGFSEANGSPSEILHVIEKHLAKYPQSELRPKLEHDAAQAALALHDDALVIRYGELCLARTPADIKLLQWVTHSLLAQNTREAAERALKYARRAEDLALQYQKGINPANTSPTEWRNETDQVLGRALTDDARATGILGRTDEALSTAQRAFETFPNADSAREVAFWLERSGKTLDAARALADAFTIPDAQATDAERAADRKHMGELYSKAKGSEDHLGDVLLAAYDRNTAVLADRERRLHQNEPNRGLSDPLAFTLSSLDGKKLEMAGLKGKVVVLDIWATYCFPCREQHPLYEKVKERFRDNPSVVFLSINTDSDRGQVKSFVSALQWQGPVYFEDGLARLFAVEDLPATVILDPKGKLYTLMKGYVPQHFVDLLTERISDALAVHGK